MWTIESKPIAWDNDSDYNQDYSSESLTDSDFKSPSPERVDGTESPTKSNMQKISNVASS